MDCTRDSHVRPLASEARIRRRQSLCWICGDHVTLGQVYLQVFFFDSSHPVVL